MCLRLQYISEPPRHNNNNNNNNNNNKVIHQKLAEAADLIVDKSPYYKYEGNSISNLQIVIEKNRMEIMTYKQHLFFNIISIQI